MKKAKYICIEGTEGVGKTTQTQLLVDFLRNKGHRVLHTKEPGTSHIDITMLLRSLMLDNKYDKVLTRPAREFISQAIRSIHLEKLIEPAFMEYDYIVQDRGLLSGLAYGAACGNNLEDLRAMAITNIDSAGSLNESFPVSLYGLYDKVIYLKGNISKGLDRALSSKQEFVDGDAMESRGNTFLQNVSSIMSKEALRFNASQIDVDTKDIQQVHLEILRQLGLES